MVKTDKSTAPLGLALFFLTLAIVPVSLKVAGYDVTISPSLSAALEAWRSVAGVLGNSSQPASDTELSLVKKYSFAEEPVAVAQEQQEPAQEIAVADTGSKGFEAEYEPEFGAGWRAEASASLQVDLPAAHGKTCAKALRSSEAPSRVAAARWRRSFATALPAFVRTTVAVRARKANCAEREAGLRRVRELVRLSRALGESFDTVRLQKDVQVFVKMKPIALFFNPLCDPDLIPTGEPATDMIRNGGTRFGVGASEEPESFEFLEEPPSFEFWFKF